MKHLFSLILSLLAFAAGAQTLTPAQLTALRTNILGSELAAKCTPFGDNPFDVAAAYNLPASPTWYAYRTNVSLGEIGDAFNGTELAGLTSLNLQRLQVIEQFTSSSVNFARADRRQFFTDVFSGAGGATTRANIAAIWSRPVTRFERLYATGTGSTGSPGTMVIEDTLTPAIVAQACGN